MSRSDFSACTPEQFSAIYKAYNDQAESKRRTDLIRSRVLASMLLQPYARKGAVIKPEDVCQFNWEVKSQKKQNSKTAKTNSREEFNRVKQMYGL